MNSEDKSNYSCMEDNFFLKKNKTVIFFLCRKPKTLSHFECLQLSKVPMRGDMFLYDHCV